MGQWETIPFHFVWVSLTVVYGVRMWSPFATFGVLAATVLATGAALLWAVSHAQNGPGLDELAEVPLMAAMFLAMVWHASRRQAAAEEVRRLAEGAQRLLESQREFVRDASHELRTPITVARGHAELIRGASGDRQIIEDADVVLDELGHLSRLSERLLLLAAAEHPDFLSLGRVAVRPLIVATASRWSPTASRKWRVDVDADGFVLVDGERLGTALDALIENAVKFTSPGDAISIKVWGERRNLIIEVSDTGPGMPSEIRERVFERFARERSDRARGSGGTGLGLAIVKAIAEAHGGSVTVESTLGAGAAFRIRLPGFEPGPLVLGEPAGEHAAGTLSGG